MDIKPYDIVEFDGDRYRIKSMDGKDKIRLIGGPWVSECDVTLIESVTVSKFEIGDEVLINPIPLIEKRDYPSTWTDGMGQMINGQVYTIREHDALDNTYLIGHFWFAPYHLTKIKDYDMI